MQLQLETSPTFLTEKPEKPKVFVYEGNLGYVRCRDTREIKCSNDLQKGCTLQNGEDIYDRFTIGSDEKMPKWVHNATAMVATYKNINYPLYDFHEKASWSFDECKEIFKDYFHTWNNNFKSKNERGINIPEPLTESLINYHNKDYVRFNASSNKKGDMYNVKQKILAQIKGISSTGPTSFSPSSLSTVYFFVVIDPQTGNYCIYCYSYKELDNVKISKYMTLGEISKNNAEIIKARKINKKDKRRTNRPRVNVHDNLFKINPKEPMATGCLM